jgi:hypothetical protein
MSQLSSGAQWHPMRSPSGLRRQERRQHSQQSNPENRSETDNYEWLRFAIILTAIVLVISAEARERLPPSGVPLGYRWASDAEGATAPETLRHQNRN